MDAPCIRSRLSLYLVDHHSLSSSCGSAISHRLSMVRPEAVRPYFEKEDPQMLNDQGRSYVSIKSSLILLRVRQAFLSPIQSYPSESIFKAEFTPKVIITARQKDEVRAFNFHPPRYRCQLRGNLRRTGGYLLVPSQVALTRF